MSDNVSQQQQPELRSVALQHRSSTERPTFLPPPLSSLVTGRLPTRPRSDAPVKSNEVPFMVPSSGTKLPPGCCLRLENNNNSTVETLVQRVREFLTRNTYIHNVPEGDHSWKCETLWLRFRVRVLDATTVQVERRFGCPCKLRTIRQSLWQYLSSSSCAAGALRRPLPAGWDDATASESAAAEADVDGLLEMLRSPRVDSQLLALEAIVECESLWQSPRLMSSVEELCVSSSDSKVVQVAKHIVNMVAERNEGGKEAEA